MHTTTFTSGLAALLSLGTIASAHMEMQFPPPLKSKFNKLATAVDSDMTSPLKPDGSNYPCKGYQSLLGSTEGGSVATFTPGQEYQYTIVGGANHNGGSCQASLSYDQGATFTAIGSIVGDCPGQTSSNFSFTVPSDAAAGENVLFAWTWFNKVGNREMYMNCASVTIGSAASKRDQELVDRDSSTAYSARPAMFVANVGTAGNGCTTTESVDVMFPNPGPDLVQAADAKPGAPNCPGGSAATTAAGSTATTAVAGGGAASSAATSKATSAATSVAAGGATSSASAPGGVFVTASSGASEAASSTAQQSAQPTTLQTATKSAAASSGTGSGAGSQTSSASAPAGTGTGSGSSGGSVGTACTDEGAWNCIDGSSFSRCASGQWSAVIPMAAGTSCQTGVSDTLVMTRKLRRDGPRRSFSAWTGVPFVVRDGRMIQEE